MNNSNECTDIFVEKNVLVLMPFLKGSSEREKQAKLSFERIKYIIEKKINVSIKGNKNIPIKYNVDLVYTGAGNITDAVERRFEKTDLFIALITETNVNVIYEVAVLNTLQQELILLLDVNEKTNEKPLPVYFQDFAYINFYDEDSQKGRDKEVRRKIDDISADPKFDIHYGNNKPPEELSELEKTINEYDSRLIQELQAEIKAYEHGDVQSPQSFRRLVRGIHPSKALSTWVTQIPYSVLQVRWNSVEKKQQYYSGPEAILGGPEVTICNSAFVNMLGINREPIDFLESYTVDSDFQLQKFSKYMSKENLDLLVKDQRRIFNKLFIKDEPAMARIPLEFNQENENQHPYKQFRGKIYLPVLIAKKVVGVRSSPHYTYYIIAFIQNFNSIKDISEETKNEILNYHNEINSIGIFEDK